MVPTNGQPADPAPTSLIAALTLAAAVVTVRPDLLLRPRPTRRERVAGVARTLTTLGLAAVVGRPPSRRLRRR